MQGALPNIRGLIAAWQNHGQNVADEIAVRVAAHAPVGTREYATVVRDSIHAEAEPTEGGVRITVAADLPDTTYPIDPVDKQALFWPGAAHPVRHVDHPFRVPSDLGEVSRDEIEEIVAAEWEQILAEVDVT